VAVARCVGDDQGSEVFGGLVAVVGRVDDLHLGHASDLGGLLGDRAAAGTGHQHMDLAADRPRQ
jgi:hypothetical protein